MWRGFQGGRQEGGNARDLPATSRDVNHKPQPGLPTMLPPTSTPDTPSFPEVAGKPHPLSCCQRDPTVEKPERPRGAGRGPCSGFIESMQLIDLLRASALPSMGRNPGQEGLSSTP